MPKFSGHNRERPMHFLRDFERYISAIDVNTNDFTNGNNFRERNFAVNTHRNNYGTSVNRALQNENYDYNREGVLVAKIIEILLIYFQILRFAVRDVTLFLKVILALTRRAIIISAILTLEITVKGRTIVDSSRMACITAKKM